MATSYLETGIVTKPVDVEAVAELLEEDAETVVECATSENINKFSPRKPIVSDTLGELEDSEWVTRHYGVSISALAPTYRKAAVMAILGYDPETIVYAETGECAKLTDLLVYDKPTNTLRISDFVGYDHNAEQSIWGVTIDESHYLFSEGNYSIDMLGTDVEDYQHIGILIATWDGTLKDNIPVPKRILVVSGGLTTAKTFAFYTMGQDILQFAEDFFPVSESEPYVFALPILMKAQMGSVTQSDDDEIASDAVEVVSTLWDEDQEDFIMLPLQPVEFDYVAPVVTASLAWGDISKKTELLDNYLVVNMTYSGTGTISSCKITLNYDYLTDPETTVTDTIEKTNVLASFSEEKIYDGTPYQVRLTCEYVVDNVTYNLEEKTISLL